MKSDKNNSEYKLYDTLKNDLYEGGFRSDLQNDYSELKEFFLNSERKTRLAEMGKIKRFFYMAWWFLEELLLKLNPTRRLVLIIGIVLLVFTGKYGLNGSDFVFSSDTSVFGGIIILFILMLELKDKLLAKVELNVGKTVQNALMSERNPKVPGWKIWLYTQSANDVGGDLVDIIKINGNKYGVTLADVSGKGLGAALLMAKLQTIIRAFAPDYHNGSEFGEKINNVFHKDILPNSFASMAYIQIEENNSNIEILNAGHFPPIHFNNESVKQLNKGSVALGLAANSQYQTQLLHVQNGDFLLIFSDGVTEAKNINSEFFGIERLLSFIKNTNKLSPEELGQKLLNYLNIFIGDAKKHDDLSIVILQKTE